MPRLLTYNANMQQDIDEFFEICFTALGWGYDPSGRHFDTVNIPEEYMQNGCFWCLYENDRLIGTSAVRTIDAQSKTAELKRLYVLPDNQGKGFGDLLFNAAVAFARENGYRKICADTRSDRSASRHLMQKYGFSEVQRYNDNEQAELFFELIL